MTLRRYFLPVAMTAAFTLVACSPAENSDDEPGHGNGDGHVDIVRGDTWFENKGGKGLEWIAHANIPMGRKGPFGVCMRTAIADMDGNGKTTIVMCDADITDSKMVILRTPDGRGNAWTKQELPQSFTYGSLHALAVADFTGDSKLDIVSNEQEELLPAGRTNPRWVMWENLGDGKFARELPNQCGGTGRFVDRVFEHPRVEVAAVVQGTRVATVVVEQDGTVVTNLRVVRIRELGGRG
jgi:hypothetical protein